MHGSISAESELSCSARCAGWSCALLREAHPGSGTIPAAVEAFRQLLLRLRHKAVPALLNHQALRLRWQPAGHPVPGLEIGAHEYHRRSAHAAKNAAEPLVTVKTVLMKVSAAELAAAQPHRDPRAIAAQPSEVRHLAREGPAEGCLFRGSPLQALVAIGDLVGLQPVGGREIQRAAQERSDQQQAGDPNGLPPAELGLPALHQQHQGQALGAS